MIEVSHVSKSFGPVAAVRDVSFGIPAGQCVGMLGPNGAGKTTTIRMITGFLPPSAGTISVSGHDSISDSIAARRLIGYLPEATPLYPEMRVRDYLDHRARLFGMARAERKAAVGKAMERCWLSDVSARRVGQLSKGYRQRVGLASALVHNPPVLILDEPTSGLDPSQIRETRTLIKDLAHERTVLVSSHILPEVEKTCDRVIIIARGRVRADGSPRELLESTREGVGYVVEVKAEGGARAGAFAALRGVAGVAEVASEAVAGGGGDGERWIRAVVKPNGAAGDLREPLAAALVRAGLVYRELSRSNPTLEQVFMRVIEEDDADVKGAAA